MAQEESTLIEAVRVIYEALLPLDENDRDRALASARALLGMAVEPTRSERQEEAEETRPLQVDSQDLERPLSLVELVQDKAPKTNPQKIALIAYYRDLVERRRRFSRSELREYFAKAHIALPKNYDRDFTAAVKNGWIYEDGNESYLTTRGIEAVESSFTAATTPTARRKGKRASTGGVRKIASKSRGKAAKRASKAGRGR